MQKNDRKRENLFKKRREKFGSYECYVYFCTAFQQGAFGRTRAGPSLLEPRRAQPKVLKRMPRKVAGVIDRGGLEIRCTACPYRGFESLTFRRRQEDVSRRRILFFGVHDGVGEGEGQASCTSPSVTQNSL